MKIGILGTGNVCAALARGFRAAGHEVTLGSRSPAPLKGIPAGVTDYASAARGRTSS